jgi:hypothetical protein
MATDKPKCTGQNRAGGPCGADAQPGKRLCIWHDPDRAEERRQWQADGGKARSHSARARREIEAVDAGIPQLPGILFQALREVEAGDIEPPVASAMATLSRAIIAASQAHELEDRLASLEQRAGIARVGA